MQKVAGVVSVNVSLNEGLTVLDLRADNTVTLAHLRQIIRNNGFVTNESQVVVQGAVTGSSGGLVLNVKGSGEQLLLRPGTSSAEFDHLRNRVKTEGSADTLISGTANTRDPKNMSIAVGKVSAP